MDLEAWEGLWTHLGERTTSFGHARRLRCAHAMRGRTARARIGAAHRMGGMARQVLCVRHALLSRNVPPSLRHARGGF